MRNFIRKALFLILIIGKISTSNAQTSKDGQRHRIDLSGKWRFALDPKIKGIDEKWYLQSLPDNIILPGTTDENKKGEFNPDKSGKGRLTRLYPYLGVAWYQKKVMIPASFAGKIVSLMLERTKETMIWVDDAFIGTNNHLSIPHVYDLTKALSAGEHTITIMVNNGLVTMNSLATIPFKLRISHALTENIQTNWNGIIGNIYLEATPPTRIAQLEVYPDCGKKEVKVKFDVFCDSPNVADAKVEIRANSWNWGRIDQVEKCNYKVNLKQGINKIELDYKMGATPLLWSEFTPSLYKISVTLKAGTDVDHQEVDFGMREFKTQGTQFTINGIKTFLRGRHDGGVFPLTGHCPMDKEAWIRVFRISKSYGINHHRFHSWTPPRAAFEAADITGVYLQPELPVWSTIKPEDPMNDYLYKEGVAIINAFGNHASFVMMGNGNEMAGDTAILTGWVNKFKEQDPGRRLYSIGSNDFLGTRGVIAGDYFTTCRTTRSTDKSFKTNVRLGFNFIDEFEGGIINSLAPSASRTYTKAISGCNVPVVGHEVGQFQIYPDYKEIPKFTGVLRPDNYEIFKRKIEKQNMQDQIAGFHKASGTFATLCYREEIETALRTPGFGGFQLLDLQDFPGQGTALVGVIDAFMHSKSFVTPKEFSQFCAPVVPLALFEKYCWTNTESFKAEIVVPNYSSADLKKSVIFWILKNTDGNMVSKGNMTVDLKQGEVNKAGKIEVKLSTLKKAMRLNLNLTIQGTAYANNYSFWVYPNTEKTLSNNITILTSVDNKLYEALARGEKVLLFPDHNQIKAKSIGGQFSPDFWQYSPTIRKGSFDFSVSEGTLSLLTNPGHPLFKNFPTDMSTNWQWWSIIRNSRPYILDELNSIAYKPIVQMVDNIERNHRLGLIFEFAVEKGKLLVCMSNLPEILDKPEAAQLYRAILAYMSTSVFSPQTKMSLPELSQLFTIPKPQTN